MKKLSVFILTVFSFFFLSSAVPTFPAVPIIIIDAGHGGEDGGSSSRSGLLEKDINLEIALKLNELCRLFGFKTVMTRETDISIHDRSANTIRQKKNSDLNKRLDISNSHQNSIFISIHQNIYSDPAETGVQVVYGAKNAESAVLGRFLQQSAKDIIDQGNRRVAKKTTGDIRILYKTGAVAAIVECGFLSNPGEAIKLTNEEYQKELAFCIINGILNFLESRR